MAWPCSWPMASTLAVPAERPPATRPMPGRTCYSASDPSICRVYPGDNRPGFSTIAVDIDITEPMGMETVIYFFLGGIKRRSS